MAEVTQVPGEANLTISQGDDMSFLVDFDIDLTGYTFESKVVESDGTETVITVTDTSLANGQITITMTDTLSAALSAEIHKWYLDRTNAGSQQRLLAGDFKVTVY